MRSRLGSSTLLFALFALACGSSADGDDDVSPYDGGSAGTTAGRGGTGASGGTTGSGAGQGTGGSLGGATGAAGGTGPTGGSSGTNSGAGAPSGGAGASSGGTFGLGGTGSGAGGSGMDAGRGGMSASGAGGVGGMASGGRGFGGRSGAGGALGGAGRAMGGRNGGAGTSAAGTGGMSDCPGAGHVTYTLTKNANPTADEQDAYDLITEAMDKAVEYYNCYTNITKATTVTYVPSIDTADGNSNGSIRFGGKSYMEYITAMHEIAHTVGVGTVSQWAPLVQNGIFTGAQATAKLRELTGIADDQVHADSQHFWPYGLNYTSEVKSEADVIDHCYIVVAIRADMGLN